MNARVIPIFPTGPSVPECIVAPGECDRLRLAVKSAGYYMVVCDARQPILGAISPNDRAEIVSLVESDSGTIRLIPENQAKVRAILEKSGPFQQAIRDALRMKATNKAA